MSCCLHGEIAVVCTQKLQKCNVQVVIRKLKMKMEVGVSGQCLVA